MSLTSIVAAVALIAILVFIHELGHFLVAKLCGVRVTVFSIGFGRRVFGFVHNGTDYRLSLLPFGGYVQMAGADPFGYQDEGEELDDPESSFQRRPIWQRLSVLAAGPIFNLILPVVVFTGLLMAGEPQPAAVVGTVDPGSPAERAGLWSGDEIRAVDGRAITTWKELGDILSAAPGGPVSLDVVRGGAPSTLTLDLPPTGSGVDIGLGHERMDTIVGVADPRSPAGRAGLRTGDRVLAVDGAEVKDWTAIARALAAAQGRVRLRVDSDGAERELTLNADDAWTQAAAVPVDAPEARWGVETASLYIGEVEQHLDDGSSDGLSGCRPGADGPLSPAFEAGLQEGDRFLSLDGKPVRAWGDVLDAVKGTMQGEGESADARPIALTVLRGGQPVALTLTPLVIRDTDPFGQYYYRPILGVTRLGSYVDGEMTRIYYPFSQAASQAVAETWGLGTFIVGHIGKLLTGEAAVKKSLGGPVEMFRQAGNAAERGLFDWARLMGMLSISLGIVNFLPVPVLDGGQILFYALEGIRGRPLSLALRERVQQVGLLFLVLLMLSVLVFDIQRIFES